MLPEVGSRTQVRRLAAELDRARDRRELVTGVGRHRAQVAVGRDLDVVVGLERGLHRRPDPLHRRQPLSPLRHVGRRELLAQDPDALAVVGLAGRRVDEARVVDEVGATDVRAEVGPEAVRLEHHQGDPATVLGLVRVAGDGVRPVVGPVDGDVDALEELGGHDIGRDIPHGDVEQGDVDGLGPTRRRALVERSRDSSGDRQATHDVAEGRRLLGQHLGARLHERVVDPPAGEVGRPVVAATRGLRTAHSLAGAAGVDDRRVDGADVVDVEPELGDGGREEVGEEDVRLADEVVEDRATLGRLDVDAHAPLATVGQLDEVVGAGGQAGNDAGADQATLGVTSVGVLDLDDIGAPVREDGTCRGHKGPRGHLHDLDSLHERVHVTPDVD